MNKKLILFVKNPALGKVKTRLAQSIGDQGALKAYLKLLHYTRKIVAPLKVEKEVRYSDFIDVEDLWNQSEFNKELQFGGDLGLRMKTAFQESFSKSQNNAVVLIGSDCAELDTSTLECAFELLKENSLVIGPAKDGGYYLIGMNTCYPQLFDEIEWSTDKVLDQTLARARGHKIDYALLQELNDVDTVEEWNLVKDRL